MRIPSPTPRWLSGMRWVIWVVYFYLNLFEVPCGGSGAQILLPVLPLMAIKPSDQILPPLRAKDSDGDSCPSIANRAS